MKGIKIDVKNSMFPEFDYLGLDKIIVPQTAAEFDVAVRTLQLAKYLGFDTESKPIFEKGLKNDGPHVVQFATSDHAYIFQLHLLESITSLLTILSDPGILKIGFGLSSDRKLLSKKFGMPPAGLLDLNTILKEQGRASAVGAKAAAFNVLGQYFTKSKKISLSNWATPTLTDRQKIYAANDAYVALRVFAKLRDTGQSIFWA